ncbi:MAG TPA: retropepsin-like aspartic protease [Candidatus Nanoarchaeia archaeon]|nr:retropepsin-like aspartic protease [Candidatus Nanoarchaeia archaeon]
MTLTFHYKNVQRPDGSTVKTPSIPVILMGHEKLETFALLDSGADISAIPLRIARILGLNLEGEKMTAYGIGGKVESVETTISLMVEKGHERYTFNVLVKVILGDYDFPILLGRDGFFDKFVISFDQQRERILLKRVNS